MRTILKPTLLLVAFLILAACGKTLPAVQPAVPPPAATPMETSSVPTDEVLPLQIEPSPSAAPTETAAPIIGVERPCYDLKARIDFPARTASVEETVYYTNNTAEATTELLLIAEPNRYPNGFQLVSLNAPGGEYAVDTSLDSNRLTIRLDPDLPAGGMIQLFIQYELILPAIPPPSDMVKPQPYGYTERQMNLVDWYLFLPPKGDNGEWLAHKPSYFGEFLVYPAADYHVELELLDAPADILVAASAENQSREPSKYLYQLQSARTFALSINSGYKMAETTIRGVTVRSYFAGFQRAAGEAALGATASALELYGDLYGVYPHETLSIVEADFLDGMEFDGLFFLSKAFYNLYDGTQRGYLTIIAVHETAHQWFFGQVGNDQAMEPWLDEAWCTFSELLYYEHYFPELVDWWWNYYEPVGYINLPVYDYPGFTAYRNAVYLRGAQFLVELREILSDEEFYAHTREYLEKYSGGIGTARGLFEVFGLPSGRDLELIAKYFQESG